MPRESAPRHRNDSRIVARYPPLSRELKAGVDFGGRADRLDGVGAKESPQRREGPEGARGSRGSGKRETIILAVALGSGSHIISNARVESKRPFESKARTL